ncbi:MAG: phage holin family protein [Candidatus Accumulibacter sp.]|jgi:uncharacterized membrane protein YqjE|nr:phage holin family protein [Accumulibacter sp.]
MGETESGVSNGVFSALRNIAATLLASGKTRLELFSNEIEVEKLRVAGLLLTAFALAFFLGVGVILAVVLLAVLFWEQRLAVLAVSALVFLGIGVVFLLRFKRDLRRPERVFSASVAELEHDLRQLKARAGHEPPV